MYHPTTRNTGVIDRQFNNKNDNLTKMKKSSDTANA